MANYISTYAQEKQYYFQFYSVISGMFVAFPALITQLEDKFSPNWTSENVFGRQDPILTFQNTERTIDVAFDVPSDSIETAERNLTNLNRLISFLYPAYSTSGTSNTISASPLLRIKFANLIYDHSKGISGDSPESGLVCGINNFSHSFKFDGSAGWVDKVGSAIPAFFSISFSATILHTHDLGYVEGMPATNMTEFPYFISDSTPSTSEGRIGRALASIDSAAAGATEAGQAAVALGFTATNALSEASTAGDTSGITESGTD